MNGTHVNHPHQNITCNSSIVITISSNNETRIINQITVINNIEKDSPVWLTVSVVLIGAVRAAVSLVLWLCKGFGS